MSGSFARRGSCFGESKLLTLAQFAGILPARFFSWALICTLAYRDRRVRGSRLWRGLALFMLVCGVGSIGTDRTLCAARHGGAFAGMVCTYAVASTLIRCVR